MDGCYVGSSERDMEPEEEHDPDKVYNEMVYVGKNIPSKTFARLQRCMDRAKPIATGNGSCLLVYTRIFNSCSKNINVCISICVQSCMSLLKFLRVLIMIR